jgi:hypothetical protein
MSNPIALPEIFKQGMEDFVIPTSVVAPFTTIQNRAQVSNSLKAIAGVERIMLKSITQLQNEFGPNGERVYESAEKDPRVRFVGNQVNYSNVNGPFVSFSLNEYFEVTFYGTGLNVALFQSSAVTLTFSVHADNVLVNTITQGSTSSGILQSRNYAPLVFVNACSGLSLDWHTVRITYATQSSPVLMGVYGVEILNERSDVAVLPGKAFVNGSSTELSSITTSIFDKKVNGTRGARVVKYIENNKVKTAIQEVDSFAKYLSLTDHTNEDEGRSIGFREFGANRADDFSAVSTAVPANHAYTLDDGTTTLIGFQIRRAVADTGIFPHDSTVGAFISITFVGTGLDIIVPSANTLNISYNILVDNVSIYSGTGTIFNSTSRGIKRICSGLPYGTHTVKFLSTTASSAALLVSDFIIYQPKKPSIPEGAFEVADYNILADYINPNAVGVELVHTGTVQKQNIREFAYVGTWSAPAVNVLSDSGFSTTTTTASSYVECTFWGTGVVYKFGNNAGAQSQTISIDGSTNLSSYTTSLNATAGLTFTSGTGIITGAPAGSVGGNNLSITGLPLGLHKIRVAWTSGVILSPTSFAIITPIHINKTSLKAGSQSLQSNQNYEIIKTASELGPDLSDAKAWFLYDSTNTRIVSSYNVSAIVQSAAGTGQVYFEKPFKRDDYIAIGSANNGTSNIVSFSTKRINNAFFTTTTSAGAFAENFIACVFLGELIDE